MEKNCRNCKYVWKSANEVNMMCRRFPPTVVVQDENDVQSYFPRVERDDVCGEHRECEA